MKPNDIAIAEFIEIWERQYGDRLSWDEAEARAALLIQLYVELGRELPSERARRSTDEQHGES